MKAVWLVAFILIAASAGALAQTPPEPGAQATPGESNPQRTDPSTATPSTVTPGAMTGPSRKTSQDDPRQDSSSSRSSSDTDMSAAADHRPKVGREAKLGGLSAGSLVQNPADEIVGRVKDIVPDAQSGDPAYVVIESRGGNTAVPYAIIAPMYHGGHVVLDRARLESAPHVTDSQLRDDTAGAEWKKQADRYWDSQQPPSLK